MRVALGAALPVRGLALGSVDTHLRLSGSLPSCTQAVALSVGEGVALAVSEPEALRLREG